MECIAKEDRTNVMKNADIRDGDMMDMEDVH